MPLVAQEAAQTRKQFGMGRGHNHVAHRPVAPARSEAVGNVCERLMPAFTLQPRGEVVYTLFERICGPAGKREEIGTWRQRPTFGMLRRFLDHHMGVRTRQSEGRDTGYPRAIAAARPRRQSTADRHWKAHKVDVSVRGLEVE